MRKLNRKITASLVTVMALGAFSGLATSKGKPDKNNRPEKEWYISNTVSVYDALNGNTYTGFNPAIMGKLGESSDGHDKHDISAFNSLASSKAAVLFIQDDWGERSGEYHSDYHGSNKQSDSWLMTVVSTVAGGKVTLSWDGLYALESSDDDGLVTYKETHTLGSGTLERLQLIDLETLIIVDALSPEGTPGSYSFTMEEGETSRNFRWVLGPINSRYFNPASGALRYIKSQQREQEAPAHGKFGMPP